jgi:succinyl-CoA synthetase alpha subunit
MAILIDESKTVLVQGITGREGAARARLMLDYGTRVVGGCTPGRGGQKVHGLPVFDSVSAAVDCLGPIDVSAVFVPAPQAAPAAFEAIAAGIPLLVLMADRVPLYDVLSIVEAAGRAGANCVGPNTLGVMSPERAVLGMMGGTAATARSWFHAGDVGVAARSGGLGASAGYYLCRAGLGISTIVHVGGDAIVGMPLPDVVRRFEADPATRLIVVLGEIGTSQEEQVAEMMESGSITKPVVAYIGGRAARSGTRYSHAGAIVEGGRESYQHKVERLRAAGAHIVEAFDDLVGQVSNLPTM